jgi:hypothetical protein
METLLLSGPLLPVCYIFNTSAGTFEGAVTGSDPNPGDDRTELVGTEPVEPDQMGRAGQLFPLRQAHVAVSYHASNGTATLPCPDTPITAPYENQ